MLLSLVRAPQTLYTSSLQVNDVIRYESIGRANKGVLYLLGDFCLY